MKRREIFAGNWKMYKTCSEAENTVKSLVQGLSNIGTREVVVFSPSPYAKTCVDAAKNSPISIGMQNMYFEDEGAFTGEVSPIMVKDCGCKYILIGHSERRHVFGETDLDVNKKIKAALKHGLDPMVCIGELLEERESGTTNEVIKRQIDGAFDGILIQEALKIVIAYEPVWAIGTGKVATPEIAEEVHALVRKLIAEKYDQATADIMPILYGGSVKPDNISGLFAQKNIDGVLVGGASLEAASFLSIINV